jgi:hypothetical protein
MLGRHNSGNRLGAGLLLIFLLMVSPGWAADKDPAEKGGKIAGILIDRKDDWIAVKADGDDEPIKYVADASDKKLHEALKATFDACRVQLVYKQEGELRRLVSVKRQVLKASGTVTGEVVKVYNDFWIEVKPKSGVADAYAPGADNFKNKEFMEGLKGLKQGDSVTITFTTDFERHRIKSLRKNAASQSKKTDTPPQK